MTNVYAVTRVPARVFLLCLFVLLSAREESRMRGSMGMGLQISMAAVGWILGFERVRAVRPKYRERFLTNTISKYY